MRRALDAVRRYLASHWGITALVAFCLYQHWDLLTWAVPATGDHMIHMYKGWLMGEQLIPSGRVTGWSHSAFAGYPAAVYYPALGDILVAATRWATLGLLSWERSYAVFFTLLLVAIAACVYVVARKVAGQLGAFVAAMLHVGDVGAWPQGGHVSTVHWAVWPFVLGMILTMFSVVACEGAISRPIRERPLRFLGFVALLAGALLGHPMAYFYLGMAAPLAVVVVAVAGRATGSPLGVVGRAALAGALALALAAFWIVPWLTTGGEWTLGWPAVGFGGTWYPLPRMIERLASNKLFDDFHWIPWALGGLGLVPALLSRRRWPTYVAVLLLVAFLFTGIVDVFSDGVIVRKAQMERMAAFLKLLWFVLAAYAVDCGARALAWARERASRRWKDAAPRIAEISRLAMPLTGAALIAAILAICWDDCYRRTSKAGRLGGELWSDIVRADGWLSRQPRGHLDRVLYQPGKLCVRGSLVSPECNEVYHRHLFASAPLRTGLPKLKFGYEATAIFLNLPLAHRWPYDAELIQRLLTRPESLETLHVRWIVSLVEWPNRPDLRLVKRFGDVWVYSAEAGERPAVSLEGPGTLEVLAFEDERIAVRVAGAGAGSVLHYPVAYFYPWRAYRGGREIPLSRHGVLPGVRKILISAAAADGITELLYVRPAKERLANWLSLLGWIACAGAAAFIAARRLAGGRLAARRLAARRAGGSAGA